MEGKIEAILANSPFAGMDYKSFSLLPSRRQVQLSVSK